MTLGGSRAALEQGQHREAACKVALSDDPVVDGLADDGKSFSVVFARATQSVRLIVRGWFQMDSVPILYRHCLNNTKWERSQTPKPPVAAIAKPCHPFPFTDKEPAKLHAEKPEANGKIQRRILRWSFERSP